MFRTNAADLSLASYDPPEYGVMGGLRTVISRNSSFAIVRYVETASGYQGTIYRRLPEHDYVIAHRGTEFEREALRDGLADAAMVLARINLQRADALELTRIAVGMAADEGQPLHVTGHSLGGTLAQITAHHYNLPGHAFNPYGAAGLAYRIAEGQPPDAAPFTNHVMAGDAVSAVSRHYGEVVVYALDHEHELLRRAGQHTAQQWPRVPFFPQAAGTLLLAGQLVDSHRMDNFTTPLGPGETGDTVLHHPAHHTASAEQLQRIHAFRDDLRGLGDGLAFIAQGGLPAHVLHRTHRAMGLDAPGAHAQRQADRERLTNQPFNPNLTRPMDPAHAGSPFADSNTSSPASLQQRLECLLAADDDSFLRMNREWAAHPAGQALMQHAQWQDQAARDALCRTPQQAPEPRPSLQHTLGP